MEREKGGREGGRETEGWREGGEGREEEEEKKGEREREVTIPDPWLHEI